MEFRAPGQGKSRSRVRNLSLECCRLTQARLELETRNREARLGQDPKRGPRERCLAQRNVSSRRAALGRLPISVVHAGRPST